MPHLVIAQMIMCCTKFLVSDVATDARSPLGVDRTGDQCDGPLIGQ